MTPRFDLCVTLAAVVAVAAPDWRVFAVLVIGAALDAGVRAVLPGKRQGGGK